VAFDERDEAVLADTDTQGRVVVIVGRAPRIPLVAFLLRVTTSASKGVDNKVNW
jgi:hypothetical protein